MYVLDTSPVSGISFANISSHREWKNFSLGLFLKVVTALLSMVQTMIHYGLIFYKAYHLGYFKNFLVIFSVCLFSFIIFN